MDYSILKRGFKANAEKLAIEFRAKLNKQPHEALCAFDLASHLEIPLRTPSDFGLSKEEIRGLTSSKSGWSALTMKNNSNHYVIIHNSRHSPSRQQSNLMHELAHIICQHDFPNIKLTTDNNFPLRHFNKLHEAEAEWLGANLQITRIGLVWCLKRHMSDKEIADYYNASLSMATFRINLTGVRNQFKWRK